MSRCFPYPPPGYSRNGATYEALIESIKLQKETDKAKAERKKEKKARKEKKKEKQRRKDEGKAKAQNNLNESQLDAHKKSQNLVDFKEAHNKLREPTAEQLEKSDLTEEHGQPLGLHKPSYSSDSTQNSNKRKREDDAILPGGTSGNGKPIKIRLLKKHQANDSSKETVCSNSGRTDPPSLCGADARVNTWKFSASGCTGPTAPSVSNPKDRLSLVSSNTKTDFTAPSGTKNAVLLSQQKPTPTPTPTPTARNQLAASSGRPILPSFHSEHQKPTSGLKKTTPSAPSESKTSGNPSTTQSDVKFEIPSWNSKPSAPKEKLISEIPAPQPTQFEKKLQKKHAKYEKLIGSWVPPVLHAPLSDDEDWLSGSGKRCRLSSRDDVERCRESAAAACSVWRPCAQFLPEAELYALPYTVPF